MLQLDPTTQASLEAATTPSARAAAILSSLSGTITVTVRDGAGSTKGSGTMTSFGVQSANVIVLNNVTSFTVSETGTPDPDTWTIEFATAGGRFVKGTFGLYTSPVTEFKWSLATWENGQSGTIASAYCTVRKNEVLADASDSFNIVAAPANVGPVWVSSTPTSFVNLTPGSTVLLGSYVYDPDSTTLTYSITSNNPNGYSINSSTGVLTIGTANQSLTVRVSDGTFVADTSFTVTISTSPVILNYEATFETSIAPFTVSSTNNPPGWVDVSSTRAREGTKSLRTYLQRGDTLGVPITEYWRSEVSQSYDDVPKNAHVWIGYSMYMPSDFVYLSDWEVAGQLKDQGGISSPPYIFATGAASDKPYQGQMSFVHCTGGVSPNFSYEYLPLGLITSLRGRWLDIVLHFYLSESGNGITELWVEGVKKLTRNGQNWPVNVPGAFWKMGLYNGWRYGSVTGSITTRELFYDCYRQYHAPDGGNYYSIVAPRTQENTIFSDTFDTRPLGKITSSIYDGGTETWRLNLNGDNTTTYLEFANSSPLVGNTRYLHTRLVKSGLTNYRSELTLLPYGRDAMTSMGSGQYRSPYIYTYRFRLKINQNDLNRAQSDTIGGHYAQWHNDDSDPGLDSSRSPPLSLWWTRNGLVVRFETNDDTNPLINGVAVSRGAGMYFSSENNAWQLPFVNGDVHDFRWRIRWDTRTRAQGGVGYVELYVDDVLRFRWDGQTCHPYPYSNGNAPYFRMGHYMGYWRSSGWPAAYEGWVMDQSYDQFSIARNNA